MRPLNLCAILSLALSACTPEPAQRAPVRGSEPASGAATSTASTAQRAPASGPEPARRIFFGPGDFERADGPYSLLPVVAESYWRPTLAEVRPLEAKLDSALSAARNDEPRVSPQGLAGYSVQYVGYVVDGRRLVSANAACRDEPGMETRWLLVLDGGACYFQATFDATAARLADVRFNGEA